MRVLHDGEGRHVTNLGTVTGTPGGVASSINNRGDIVGSDQDAGRQSVNGWVGTPGSLTSLTSLLVDGGCFFVIEPIGVNDAGFIAANARGCTDTTLTAVMLEPIKTSK